MTSTERWIELNELIGKRSTVKNENEGKSRKVQASVKKSVKSKTKKKQKMEKQTADC